MLSLLRAKQNKLRARLTELEKRMAALDGAEYVIYFLQRWCQSALTPCDC
jgi:hypothetical protein